MILTGEMKYWWNGTDRGKQKYWWNGTDRGNKYWWNDTDRRTEVLVE